MLEWHGERVMRSLAAEAKRRSRLGAEAAADVIREEISITGGASSPGQYPHKQTGELHDGIETQEHTSHWSVVSSAPHAAAVEKSRPYFMRAIRENMAAIRHALLRG